MAEAKERGGQELQAAEPLVDLLRTLTTDDPTGDGGEQNRQKHANDGRHENENDGFHPAAEDECFEAGVSDRCTAVAANQCVRRAGRQAEDEGDEIPRDGAEKPGEQHLLSDQLDVDHAFADGASNGGAENESGDKVPERGPGHGAERCEHSRGDYGGNGIGGVMPSVREFEGRVRKMTASSEKVGKVYGLPARG